MSVTTTSQYRPFTNDQLSTAFSPRMVKQVKERESMLNQYKDKTNKFNSMLADSEHLTSVISRMNKGKYSQFLMLRILNETNTDFIY